MSGRRYGAMGRRRILVPSGWSDSGCGCLKSQSSGTCGTEWQLFWNRKRPRGFHCRRAYLIEITPHRIIDDYCPAVGEGPDRMANIAWHDPHHSCPGDLRHSVDGQLELAIDHLVYFFLRMEVFVNS